eukprot:gene4893-5248_t
MSQVQKLQVQKGINRFGGMASLAIALGFAGNANADSLSEANTKLAEYGFPPILFVPSGFSPVVSEFGRGGLTTEMKNPILVQFASPNLWVVQKTSVNNNGEAGTISTNDYQKGDSAFLYVLEDPKKEKLTLTSTDLIRKFIKKAVSQKGDLSDNLKIYQIKPGPVGADQTPYYIVDFSYELNTGAGFVIARRGVASITSVGEGFIQGLVAATIDRRWGNAKKAGLEQTLRSIVDSFRVYRLNSGIFAAN